MARQEQAVSLVRRAGVDGAEWEQIAYAEVLVPGVVNVYGDLWTEESIREAAYMFMERGFQIDIDHDNVDVTGDVHVVESFIVRNGDPDFIKGSWVVAVHILDADIWQQVLDCELNGFSYEAVVSFLSGTAQWSDNGQRQGTTEPDPFDGHVHEYMVLVDGSNRPISGGTTETNGHTHTITLHTVTDEAAGHVHRYNIVKGVDGL